MCVSTAPNKKKRLAEEGTPECCILPEDTPRIGFTVRGDFSVQFCGFSSVSFASFPPTLSSCLLFHFHFGKRGRGQEANKKRGGGGREKAEAVTRF